jgi:hypothetical protein
VAWSADTVSTNENVAVAVAGNENVIAFAAVQQRAPIASLDCVIAYSASAARWHFIPQLADAFRISPG